jgi:hypothetical protein
MGKKSGNQLGKKISQAQRQGQTESFRLCMPFHSLFGAANLALAPSALFTGNGTSIKLTFSAGYLKRAMERIDPGYHVQGHGS